MEAVRETSACPFQKTKMMTGIFGVQQFCTSLKTQTCMVSHARLLRISSPLPRCTASNKVHNKYSPGVFVGHSCPFGT